MDEREPSHVIGGIIALTMVLVLLYVASSFAIGFGSNQQAPPPQAAPTTSPADRASSLGITLLVFFAETLAMAYFVRRSVQGGIVLVVALFLVFFGHNAVVLHIESLIFLQAHLPTESLWKIVGMNTLVALLYAPLAVLLLGRRKRNPDAPPVWSLLRMPWGDAVWKIGIASVSYVALYLLFGYYVAWKQPAVQAYYGGTDPGSFFAQLTALGRGQPWLFAVQLLRGALWIGFAYPLIRFQDVSRSRALLACGFLFSVWSLQLLLPNPFMPHEVRMIHLREILISNFLFGALASWLFSRSPERTKTPHPSPSQS